MAEGNVSARFSRNFQGKGSVLATEQSAALKLGSSFTIELGMKAHATGQQDLEFVIFIRTTWGLFHIILNHPQIMVIGMGSPVTVKLGSQADLREALHHVAFVGQSNTLSIYVDKVLKASGPMQYDPAFSGETTRFYLGGSDVANFGFNGTIDRVRIAGTALGPDEFFSHRNSSLLILEPLLSQNVNPANRAVLRVGANPSAGPLTYEWTFTPTHEAGRVERRIEGANSDTLVIDAAERSDDGVYSVRVSNTVGKSESSKALLSVGRGLPIIQTAPVSQTVNPGVDVQFTVEAYNDRWMSYGWLFNGVELAGENGPTLVLTNVQASHAGRYTVLVRTPTWTEVAPDAILTVLGTDTIPPEISITSPASGLVQTNRITVTGTMTDNVALRSASLEVNGSVYHTFSHQNFSVTGVPLTFGTNIVTIRATDHSGNTSSKSIVVIHAPERYLFVPGDVIAQEGGYVTLPIMFQSTGGVGGLDFYFNYWSNRLSAPKITWLVEKPGARGSLVSEFGRFRASFDLPPGETIPAGDIQLAEIRFKALSLPEPFFALFDPRVIAIRSSTGAAFESGNGAFGAGITVTVREITADNNANDRLDVGDAAAIQRRLAGLDTLQPHDIAGNDLNGDQSLDMDDAVRVLRTVVELDSQPHAAGAARVAAKSLRASAASGATVRLSTDGAEIRAGEKVKVSVQLAGNDRPLEGASFKLEYPPSALRLDGAESHAIGPIMPRNASTLWNVAPSQDYQSQNGSIYLAACSAASWAETNGTLAEFIFTVQPGASAQQSWPVRLSRMELSHEADLQTLAGNEIVMATASELPVLTISNPTVTEGNSGMASATFTVSLSAAGAQTASVAYATADGTAQAGEDYAATSGMLTFAPGVLSQTITVQVLGDAITEPAETFVVNLSNPVNAILGAAQATGTILNNDSNAAPALTQPEDVVLVEGQTLSIAMTAVDAPEQTLVFALTTDAPLGMHIEPDSGLLTWVPGEYQGPSTNNITVTVTDDGFPPLSSTRTFSVTVLEENRPPTLIIPESRAIEEGALLVLTIHATDQDWPTQVLTFSLGSEAPPEMRIDGETGVLTWTPGEFDGPNTNHIRLHVRDNGSPAHETNVMFMIVVRESNQRPVLAMIEDQFVTEGETLTLAASGTDADLPKQTLKYELGPGAPTGMEIDETTGVLTWAPEELSAAARLTNWVTVILKDSGTPELSDTVTFRVIAGKANQPPVLLTVGDSIVGEGEALTLTNIAHDADVPTQVLTFALTGAAPKGMSIDQRTGVLKWTPSEAQGGSTNLVTIRVIDDGNPPMIATARFLITVIEENDAPQIGSISDQKLLAGQSLTVTVHATDKDLPSQNLRFSLAEGAPEGMLIDPTSGIVSWTPKGTIGPGNYAVTVIVSDDGAPPKQGSASFAVNISGPPYLKLTVRGEPSFKVDLAFENFDGQWVIEESADLENWTPMVTIENGLGSSVVVDGLNKGSRFYRGRMKP